MKIYKFRDLSDEEKHSHFIEIVLDKTIWCASPDSLNDEEEFKFKLDYEHSTNTSRLLSEVINKYRNTKYIPADALADHALTNNNLKRIAQPIVKDMIKKCRKEIGIVSFSASNKESQLWEKYGGNGNGVYVEIDIPNHFIENSYFRVHYVKEKIFHVDSFFESTLFPDRVAQMYRNMLLTKTEQKWKNEEEIRFIGNRQNVKLVLDGYISEVTFGENVPSNVFKNLALRIKEHCDKNGIRIKKL